MSVQIAEKAAENKHRLKTRSLKKEAAKVKSSYHAV